MREEEDQRKTPHVDATFIGDKTRDVLVLVIGLSGTGKSYFINKFLSAIGSAKRVLEGDKLSPCTLAIEPVIVQERGWVQPYPHISAEAKHARFIIVDTPGFDTGPTSSDFEILKRLTNWVKRAYPRALSELDTFLVGGVVYLHDITRDKQPDVTSRNLCLLDRILGGQVPLCSTVLVTTKWAKDENTIYDAREKQLVEGYWAELIKPRNGEAGAQETRFRPGSVETEEKSALEILRPVFRRFDKFVGEAALEGLSRAQKSFEGLRIKSEATSRDMKAALDRSVMLHFRALALEENAASQEEVSRLTQELEASNQEVYGLFGDLSTWNLFRLSFLS